MKRYLIQLTALSLLALAAGCQKERDGIDNEQNNQTVAVNISIDGLPIDAATSPAAGDAATTRSVVDDITDITVHGFTIAGYYTHNYDTGVSGKFDDNLADLEANVFNHDGGGLLSGDGVIKPEYKDGKYEIKLNKWSLRSNSYLSYVAWASKVAPGMDAAVVDNPIVDATKNDGAFGAYPFITVTSGTTSKSLNVDVVAAKSTDNVNDVVRSAMDLDFKHVLTKLKFRVKNNSPVAMTLTGARVLFASGKVARKATYSIDGKPLRVGTWGTFTDNTAAAYPITLTTTDLAAKGAAVPLEELLIIPQALTDGAISVELTYTMPNGGATASTYIRTVPLKARTVEQNTSYTYEISLNETQITINEGRIGAWIDVPSDLPYIAGARDAKVLLLLDGYDAPYTHTDGTQYWLDRSGWNRHCKLVGNVSYYVPGKHYFCSGDAGAWLEVPAFPATTEATIDIITNTGRNEGAAGGQNLFYFSNASDSRVMYSHFGISGSKDVYFDAGQTSNADNKYTRVHSADIPYLLLREVSALYSFSKSATNQAIYRNLLYQYNTLDPAQSGHGKVDLSTATSRRFGVDFRGDIKYIKVSSVAKPQITKTEYADLAKRHRLSQSDYLYGYDKNGLVLDLQGYSGPVNGYWKDLSGSGAHAKLVGNVIYDADKKEYQTRDGGYLDIQIPAAWKADRFFDAYVLELVYYAPKKPDGSFYDDGEKQFRMNDASGQYVILFRMGSGSKYSCNLYSHLLYYSRDYNDGGKIISTRHSYYGGVQTNGAYLEMRIDNGWNGATSASDPRYTKGVYSVRIGESPLNISAVRIYNRWKDNLMNKANVEKDKGYYNI